MSAQTSAKDDPEKLTAGQRSKIRRLSRPKEIAPEDEAGELNIVPFLDIITNVLMFVLASISVTFTVALMADPPKSGGGGLKGAPNTETLNLTVLITSEGYAMKAKGGSIGPGCEVGGGITVPRVQAKPTESSDGKRYDIDGIQKCARKMKEAFPGERQVMIAANPNIPFQEIVRLMDGVRDDEKGELFPDVQFTMLSK